MNVLEGTASGRRRRLLIVCGRKCFEHIFVFFLGRQASPRSTAWIQSWEYPRGKENNDMFLSLELESHDWTIQ